MLLLGFIISGLCQYCSLSTYTKDLFEMKHVTFAFKFSFTFLDYLSLILYESNIFNKMYMVRKEKKMPFVALVAITFLVFDLVCFHIVDMTVEVFRTVCS